MKIKLLNENATPPTYADEGAAGLDLYASEEVVLWSNRVTKVPTGVAIELPKNFYGALVGRSGLAARGVLCHYGTIDQSFRGEVAALLYNTTDLHMRVKKGDRIAQLIVQPYSRVALEVVEELSDTSRGEKGFGSTGS